MIRSRLSILGIAIASSLLLVLAFGSPTALARQDEGAPTEKPTEKPGEKPGEKQEKPKSDREKQREADKQKAERAKWFDKLDKDDRAAVDFGLGYEVPAIPEGVEFLNMNFKKFGDLRGKVIVIQTFTSRNAGGLVELEKARLAATETKLGDDKLVFIGVHIPEGADKAKTTLEKKKSTVPVILDAQGALCDALGAYRKPIAFMVDRQGNLRYAGLTEIGIKNAALELAAESFDESVEPKKRSEKPIKPSVEFPTFSNGIKGAIDLRGKPGPAVYALEWWNRAPDAWGKLVLVDFWATWCEPCRKMIPHVNDIATAYPRDVACMGISDETKSNFEQGLRKQKLKDSDFRYSIGVDPAATMKKAFQISAIPHVVIMSADGIVRWQGHPVELTPPVMDSLVRANRLLVEKAVDSAPPNRWARGKR